MKAFTDIKKVEKLPMFFIVGRPRTGTSLIRILLDAHPNIQIPIESPVIIDQYGKYGKITLWDKKLLLAFYDDLFKLRRFKEWGIDEQKLKMDLLSCEGSNSFQNLCKIVHLNYKSVFEKNEVQLIGDKNPQYSLQPEKLLKLFPDAKFIHLRRDYRDHYLSMKRADFYDSRLSLIIYNWKLSERKLEKLKQNYNDSFLTLNYEDFVKNPEVHLKEVMNFLNCEYIVEVLDFYKQQEKLEKIYGKEGIDKLFGSLLQSINADKVNQWRLEMKDKEIKIADFIAGKYAEKAGYKRRFTEGSIRLQFYILPRVFVINIYNLYKTMLDVMPVSIGNSLKRFIPGPVKFYSKIFSN